MDDVDGVFKVCLASAALAAGLGFGYYYGIFLPDQAAAAQEERRLKAEQKVSAELAKAEEERQAKEREQAEKITLRFQLDGCIQAAQEDYSARWNKTCVRLHSEDSQYRSACLERGLGEDYCSTIPVRPANECALPSDLANDYDAGLARDKELCVTRFNLSA